jgi:hypothetical protein
VVEARSFDRQLGVEHITMTRINHRCPERVDHVHDRVPAEHRHHPVVPHGERTDDIREGRLHHHHGDHCDDHGSVDIIEG